MISTQEDYSFRTQVDKALKQALFSCTGSGFGFDFAVRIGYYPLATVLVDEFSAAKSARYLRFSRKVFVFEHVWADRTTELEQ